MGRLYWRVADSKSPRWNTSFTRRSSSAPGSHGGSGGSGTRCRHSTGYTATQSAAALGTSSPSEHSLDRCPEVRCRCRDTQGARGTRRTQKASLSGQSGSVGHAASLLTDTAVQSVTARPIPAWSPQAACGATPPECSNQMFLVVRLATASATCLTSAWCTSTERPQTTCPTFSARDRPMCSLPSSPCPLVSLTLGMPNIWRGILSTTGPNSIGLGDCVTRCALSRRLPAGPLGPPSSIDTTRSTTS